MSRVHKTRRSPGNFTLNQAHLLAQGDMGDQATQGKCWKDHLGQSQRISK